MASLLIVWGLGCLPRVSRQRLPERAKVAVAFVVDASATGSAFPAPEALERAIVDELAEHNLEAVKVPAEALASQRLSDGRFDALGKAAGAPFALLVEQRVRFFSQLDGRYRWEVSTTLTASASGGAVSRASFGIPVTLMYDHEKEPEAIASVAADIAGRVGTLMDGVLLSAAPVSTPVQPPVVVTSPRSTGIYFVMVDRFSDGDRSNDGDSNPADSQAFHGGDLQGVIDHLDWIQSLGFDTVWLSPIFKMRTEKWHGYGAFHGYWTWDLAALEPRFGDELLLARLRSELDRRKMKLMLDVVLNHVGPDAPLLTSKPGWFHKRGGVTDWNDATQLVMNDVHGLPDLATEQDEVFQYLLAAARRWVRVARPDGFRLDAVKHLPLEFWAKFNGSFDLVLLGELLDGDPGTIARTWREGHFTSMFDFPLGFAIADVFCRGESPAKLAAVLTSDRRYPDPSQLVTLVDNHDLPRILSQCGGDVEKVKQALAFLISMRGTPSLLWGTEVGLDGAKEPDNRKSMRFVEHPLREHIAKWMKLRAESAALSTGAALPVEVSRDRTVIARIAADGTTVNVKIEAGKVTLEDAAKSSPELVTQWRTGARTKRVTISGSGSVVGSGAELGDWDRKKAKPLPLTVDLPINGVFEFKRIINGDWEPGPNRLLFVTEATAGVSL